MPVLSINHLIEYCIHSGNLRTAQYWLEQWQQLQPSELHENLDFVENAINLLDKSKVTDEAVAEMVQISYAVLHDNGIYYTPEREVSIEQDEWYSTWITFDIEIPGSVEESVNLTVELADKFAETNLGIRLDDKILVSYEPGLK
jgi:hypothetical protein